MFFRFLLTFLISLVAVCSTFAQGTTATTPAQKSWGENKYQGAPWKTNISRPYAVQTSLTNKHLFVSPSHGRYYNGEYWRWQRPQIFCTSEDLLTQSFVFPYLIPMLENAGAIVFSPRERDPQPNEAVVDNDQPGRFGSYEEENSPRYTWTTAQTKGFSMPLTTMNATYMPFEKGTSRFVQATHRETEIVKATWTPTIPKSGRYAVYVSYPSLENAIPDARYTVFHSGGQTTFTVNQQMGGGTWLYLGSFLFQEGKNAEGRVMLSNYSQHKGVVSADAVRFGGGMALIERSMPEVTINEDSTKNFHYGQGITSGLRRQLEAARYYAQWSGLPDTLYNLNPETADYDDDIRSRSHLLNFLGGGSVYIPDTVGQKVPFELAFALHTDAGFLRKGGVYGSLGIATTTDPNGSTIYRSGLDRKVSYDYARRVTSTVASDMAKLFKTSWPLRDVLDRNYGETRMPNVPSTILELLAHQNFNDMVYAHDPNFKFHASRAIYKSILRQVAENNNQPSPVVQPLPVKAFSARLRPGKNQVRLTWQPTNDPLEASATPTDYIVYSRTSDSDFDQGHLTKGKKSITLALKPGKHYIFRVAAINAGGESFPSQPLSIYLSPSHEKGGDKEVLVVNAFNRLSGPARVESPDSLGFLLNEDLGVPFEYSTAFCGEQVHFSPLDMGKEGPGSLGDSSSELVGHLIAGNRFDGVEIHTDALIESGHQVSVSSVSSDAFAEMTSSELSQYSVIDYVAGLERDVPHNLLPYKAIPLAAQNLLASYQQHGGKLFVSGSFIGSDMKTKPERDFLRRVLHVEHEGSVRNDFLSAFHGLRLQLPIYNQHNSEHFPCPQTDVLAPSEGAFSAFSYGEGGFSAGVAYQGKESNTLTLGFPFECLINRRDRSQAMGAVLNFLLQNSK